MSVGWKQGKNGQTWCQSLSSGRRRLVQGLFLGRKEIPENPSMMTKRRKTRKNLHHGHGLGPTFEPVLAVSLNIRLRKIIPLAVSPSLDTELGVC